MGFLIIKIAKKIIKSNLVGSELSGSSSSIAIIFELGFRNEKFGT
jgi:hypothetical protein